MARPKKGQPGHEEALKKWRETMLKKYGGEENLHKKMQAIGSIGGRNGKGPEYKGGFAANPEFAKICGRKGGSISRRTGVANGQGKKHLLDIETIEKTLQALKMKKNGRD